MSDTPKNQLQCTEHKTLTHVDPPAFFTALHVRVTNVGKKRIISSVRGAINACRPGRMLVHERKNGSKSSIFTLSCGSGFHAVEAKVDSVGDVVHLAVFPNVYPQPARPFELGDAANAVEEAFSEPQSLLGSDCYRQNRRLFAVGEITYECGDGHAYLRFLELSYVDAKGKPHFASKIEKEEESAASDSEKEKNDEDASKEDVEEKKEEGEEEAAVVEPQDAEHEAEVDAAEEAARAAQEEADEAARKAKELEAAAEEAAERAQEAADAAEKAKEDLDEVSDRVEEEENFEKEEERDAEEAGLDEMDAEDMEVLDGDKQPSDETDTGADEVQEFPSEEAEDAGKEEAEDEREAEAEAEKEASPAEEEEGEEASTENNVRGLLKNKKKHKTRSISSRAKSIASRLGFDDEETKKMWKIGAVCVIAVIVIYNRQKIKRALNF